MPALPLAHVDLLALIRAGTPGAFKRVTQRDGGEYAGPCPFCGGNDRFHVWPHADNPRYWCRQCGHKGDAITFVREKRGLSFSEACEFLKIEVPPMETSYPPVRRVAVRSPQTEQCLPPTHNWQMQGRTFLDECEECLWGAEGQRAMAYLRGRGLSRETIEGARLGYNPVDSHVLRPTWGLTDDPERGKVWLPRGIVIPTFYEGQLWQISIRRPVPANDKRKYAQVGADGRGTSVLWGADNLRYGQPAILVEGVLDALSIQQVAEDIITPVASGTTTGARRVEWLGRLALSSLVLVALDADEGGQQNADYWLNALGLRAVRWSPTHDDPSKMLEKGLDLRGWVEGGLLAAAGQKAA